MPVLDMNKLACEVFDIEANAILKLKESLGISFDKAIDLLYKGMPQEQLQILWFAVCLRYPFIKEFASEVLYETCG